MAQSLNTMAYKVLTKDQLPRKLRAPEYPLVWYEEWILNALMVLWRPFSQLHIRYKTWICDFILLSCFFLFHVEPLMNGDGGFTSVALANMMVKVDIMALVREYVMLQLCRDHAGPAQIEMQSYLKDFSCQLSTVKLAALFWVAAWCYFEAGIFVWESLWSVNTWIRISLEFCVMIGLKDIVFMNYLHGLMHREKWEGHETHHRSKMDMNIFRAMNFEILDVLVEDGCGPVLAAVFLYLIKGDYRLHAASFMLTLWFDITVHSLNVFTLSTMNPLLHMFFHFGVAHQLHHCRSTANFILWPIQHLDRKKALDDYRRYEKATDCKWDYSFLEPSKQTA